MRDSRAREIDVEIYTVATYPRIGGMTTWIDRVARGLARSGMRVCLHGITDMWDECYRNAPFEARHHYMPSPRGGLLSTFDQWSRWHKMEIELQAAQKGQPTPHLRISDSTHGVMRTVHSLCRKDGAPWVIMAGGDIFAETQSLPLSILRRRHFRAIMNRASSIIVDGRDLVESLSARGIRQDLLQVQQLGIDPSLYADCAAQPCAMPERMGKLKLRWHGRHSDYNGPLRFIETALGLDGAQPRMCGEGPQTPETLRRLKEAGHPEWYVGALPQGELPAFLGGGECGVYPLKNMAGLPRVLLESMASGLATLSSEVGACRELIDHGENGFVCRDQEEMARTLVALRDNPALLRQTAEAGRKTILNDWSEEATIAKLARFLEGLFR